VYSRQGYITQLDVMSEAAAYDAAEAAAIEQGATP
jgi:hypothetical protein